MTLRCKALALALALLCAAGPARAEEAEQEKKIPDVTIITTLETVPAPIYDLPDGFCYLHDVIPDIILDIRYAGTHNFVGDVIDGYEAPYAIMTCAAAEQLKIAADAFREMGYRIMVFDAYRPLRAVKHFQRWSDDPDDMRMRDEFYPDFKNKHRLLAHQYIASNSRHCWGSTVDMTITDMDGNPLDMGTGFDFFGKKAWHTSKSVTEEQAANRTLLKTVMEQNGFYSYEKEWWHYSLKNPPFTESFDFVIR